MPTPPPPYTPNPSQGMAQSMSQAMQSSPQITAGPFANSQGLSPQVGLSTHSPLAITSTGTSPGFSSRLEHSWTGSGATAPNSTPPAAAPSFPPPPPRQGRDRSLSRTRMDKGHSVFSLSALTSRNRGNDQSSSSSAIDALHQQTTEALARAPAQPQQMAGPSQHSRVASTSQHQQPWSPESAVRPPASRRAASTGGIGMSQRDAQDSSPSSRAAWEPGMPLPPPPPGPPPSGARSQSMNRSSEISSRGPGTPLAAPAPRRPQHANTLGPIPPTPADWTEEDQIRATKSPYGKGLQINTRDTHNEDDVTAGPSHTGPFTAHPSSSNAGLGRTGAKRDTSARGIRERRSESRAARERLVETQSAVEPSNNPWARDMVAAPTRPANLILATPDGAISQRRKGRNTPTSGRSLTSSPAGQSSAKSNKSYGDLQTAESSRSTPRQEHNKIVMSPKSFAPTPPFSPGTDAFEKRFKAASVPPPKTLPTPPPHQLPSSSSSFSSFSPQERPVSHILHTPNDNVNMVVPLMPSRPASSAASKQTPKPTDQELFALASVERYRSFIDRESTAATDQERLELFADFIVHESRLRRDRYSAAFEAMASDILDLTRDMWRSYTSTGRRSATPNMSLDSLPERKDSTSSSHNSQVQPSPAASSASYNFRMGSESPVSSDASHGRSRGDSQPWQPCLSPIPSMAVSTVPDEEDSRGRSASRWWEGSADGSNGKDNRKLERSKRESKYMGVPKEAREYLQWDDNHSPSQGSGTPGPNNFPSYGPDEYPPEKVGWHEQTTPHAAVPMQFWQHSAPATPDPYKLDVSRLVTLPPPYPRHHPAVNNNHPELATIRANLRALQDPEEVKAIKEAYRERSNSLREKGIKGANDRRAELRGDIQDMIRAGEMTFADAAKAEAEFDVTEAQITRRRVQQDFDMYQKDVMTPVHAILAERVLKATASIERLRNSLFNDAQTSDPNQTQEEGDETPELLEKLTLLKWLFDCREQLHKDMFELEGERNELYKTVVLTPYILANNMDKVREAEDFFRHDKSDRTVAFSQQVLSRYEEFAYVIEQNVTRGVEDQLSAFWDIAPGLMAVVQKVPSDLEGFEILVPPQEYNENPSYHDFPLQYLMTLLAHAEKSAYQFIESQTNLLCLLHEVKTAVMMANSRLVETQRWLAGEDFASVEHEMQAIKRDEEARLTEDLKDKVGLVEGQWAEALGKGLAECKRRVEGFLVSSGGWDESLRE
ncbi:uncharacterized protein K452DRAFT_100020 [Aplosporella prunicola CBS 121167]|uniref:Uncharacterized protein n=1 Tax=Aplosporella prunicola CBS 121167 TaxID=1176127 RepID=A0A6A6B310_9PEZI|nr:uncharacterized protein K452DRAFT_100020 [Aplosporella prunicola CBS 121167]KAF2137635.1 hypothetical protein K452DRAFT_100020 [Aplosporella prunicola CBS 121167]